MAHHSGFYRCGAVCIAILLALPIDLRAADAPAYGVRLKGYLDANGRVVRNVTLVVEDGKITKVGKRARPPEGAPILNRTRYYAGPGLIEIHAGLGVMRRSGERAHAFEPLADASDLFNPDHEDFGRAAQSGITTIVLAPSSANVVGGATVIAKTGGADPSRRRLGRGPLKLSLTAQAFSQPDRTPTSLQGALQELRNAIAAARENEKDDSPFSRWARGESVALVDIDDAASITVLAQLAQEIGVQCIPVHANLAAERLEDARYFEQPLVLGTYEFHDPLRYTRVPGLLESAGVPVILTSEPPRYAPELLRVGMAIAMRNGLSRKGALSAVTSTPAAVLGLDKRIGALAPGYDADFVLYSGDPLRLTSTVEETYINGERVYVRTAVTSSEVHR